MIRSEPNGHRGLSLPLARMRLQVVLLASAGLHILFWGLLIQTWIGQSCSRYTANCSYTKTTLRTRTAAQCCCAKHYNFRAYRHDVRTEPRMLTHYELEITEHVRLYGALLCDDFGSVHMHMHRPFRMHARHPGSASIESG